MPLRSAVKNLLNRVLKSFDAQILSNWEIQSIQAEINSLRNRLTKFLPSRGPSFSPGMLPQDAEDYLRTDNPRLSELRSRYAGMHCPAISHSQWNTVTSEIDLRHFRGDNPYVWQYQDGNAEVNYFLTTSFLQSIDRLKLFERLQEDDLFGACTFRFDETLTVSRDLLDSISEITFLEEAIGISRIRNLKILDIGAGYGRLAYRLSSSLPGVEKAICTDAVPESTFVSEYYLRFRKATEKTQVVPLDEIEAFLDKNAIHLAINIHSFSECTIASISWWLDLLGKHNVRYFFLVPNAGEHGGARLLSTELPPLKPVDFMPEILARGYRIVRERPKYGPVALQKHGVSPTRYYLFEKVSAAAQQAGP